MTRFLVMFCCCCSILLFAQEKKIVGPEVYNDWKKLSQNKISETGRFTTYRIEPYRGDGWLYLYQSDSQKIDSIFRGEGAQFSSSEKYWVYHLDPGFDTLRKLELDKVDKKKWPKDTLVIADLVGTKQRLIPSNKSYKLAPKGDWMAYLIDSTIADIKEPETKNKKRFLFFKSKKNDKKPEKVSSKGHFLCIFNPVSGEQIKYENVTDYQFSDSGEVLLLKTHWKKGDKEIRGLEVYDLVTKQTVFKDSNATEWGPWAYNPRKSVMAYMKSSDTTDNKNFVLHLFDIKDQKAYPQVDSNSAFMPQGFMPTSTASLYFTDDNRFLAFHVSVALQNNKDTLLEREKPKLDVWHYNDGRLQPEQLVQQKRDRENGWLTVMDMQTFHLTVLENDSTEVRLDKRNRSDYELAVDVRPYQRTYNWVFPNPEDHYRIHLFTGKKELLAKAVSMGGKLSPSGRYYDYFDSAEEQHFLKDLEEDRTVCLTCDRKDVNWQYDLNGQPHVAYPYGTVGYDPTEENIYLQSEKDVWVYNIADKDLYSLSGETGMRTNQELRLQFWERDSLFVDLNATYLKGLNKLDKSESIWLYSQAKKGFEKGYEAPYALTGVERDKAKNHVFLRKMSVIQYPDWYILSPELKDEKRISFTNPQQTDYNWATVSLMDYTSRDGQQLQSLVYVPENFDSTKRYPLMVYFYELYTDEIHNHYPPKPTASIIYPTEYASAGYVVLIPDIRYKTGYPAKSAYNCIMGATDAVLKKYNNIDSNRMALQGQSWGGYQTAQLITMTNRYKAAMAGAPVANMFSAYGGIRWGSGLNRQFQYERTQSRIGKTIWEAPELYIENSPLFHLPKVNTPLLIMHNDGDGAVPWYQGIELFTGLRRLNKQVWLLNYNDDDHNLMKEANRMDLSIRMRQFFDHYLMGEPAPKWMTEGLPATEKGRTLNYQLAE